MSGGDRNRKKGAGGQGWEEAGAEFYQESYPSNDVDFDVLQRDPHHLATLLPSKQTRAAAATVKRIRTNMDTKTFRRQTATRSRRGSTTRRASTTADVQVSMLPDLSENLSNEQRTWDEIMQIKALPVPMAQKREMKAKLQSEPNLRMQGFEQLKWKRRKVWEKLQAQVKEGWSKLELWKNDLKKIEGNCGTGVVAYFLFIKWLLFLNLGIFGIIFLFVVLPHIIFNIKESVECADCCSSIYFNRSGDDDNIFLDLVQGTGKMERTLLFYGMYSNVTFAYDVNGTMLYYDLPLAYICVTITYFLLSLIAIVKSAAKGFKERLIEGEGQFYQYCNLIFGGWDFCIHNQKTAESKHRAIYNEIRGHLEVEFREEERQNRTQQEKTKLFIVRLFVNLAVLLVLSASAVGIFFVFEFSTQKTDVPGLNVSFFDSNIEKLFYEFLPSICIVFLNILVPIIFSFLVKFEKLNPLNIIRFTLGRTVFLRLSSLLVLYASLYHQVSCEDPESSCLFADCNSCWETFVGQQIYKLFLTDFAIQIFLTFFVNFPRSLIARHSHNKCAKFIGAQNFEIPKHVLDVIYSQTLCWLGCFYAPLLPLIATFTCFFMFYVKKFACLVNGSPSVTIYRASRSNSMFMIVLLVSYIFAILPIAFAIGELLPSQSCGPFRSLTSVWSYVFNVFTATPFWFQNVAFFISTAGFGVPAFVVLTLLLYYYWAVNSANRHMVVVLKNQLVLEGHDKQFLLDRLSIFIKQQQESAKRLRHYEMTRDGERNVSSS